MEEVLNQLDGIAEEARRIQMALRPSVLDDLGILPALSWFCREFQNDHSGIHVKKEIDLKEGQIPNSIKNAIFRITQEAFNNSARHSDANSLSVSLTKKDSSIDLVIRDNGVGFDVDNTLSEGFQMGLGLASMKERVEASGGLCHIESTPGKGTIILVSWPSG
jgi:signal transduction histidine kinase